ncbi:YD repeat-containing protein [Jannaschia pohangensis]|uniref:YD repeat-containing protein n=1 Tax=Jannaschia pohangensis TaxID=390807 RepID=A0A1I3MJU3_9RHOB|nr:YD repeat-containing protein [Jannaschia pohangensis]
MSDAPTISFKPGSLGWIKALTVQMTGKSVDAVTAPGGKGRQSVRLQLDDGSTVIATRRAAAARAEAEAGLLQVLSSEGAPVPRVIGFREGLLLQQDGGRNRLSHAMVKADPDRRIALARAAMASLDACRAAMDRRLDVLARLPGLGTRPGWAEDLVSQPYFLSGDLAIARPQVDADALARSLTAAPSRFTRWDARLANGSVQPDGTVLWFDWDMFGRRSGVEDLSWMIADDWWGIDRAPTDDLLAEFIPDETARKLARRLAVLVAANRLKKIAMRLAEAGWTDAEEALRLDRMGAVPSVVDGLCHRMGEIADTDSQTAGFAPWFADVAGALRNRYPTAQA